MADTRKTGQDQGSGGESGVPGLVVLRHAAVKELDAVETDDGVHSFGVVSDDSYARLVASHSADETTRFVIEHTTDMGGKTYRTVVSESGFADHQEQLTAHQYLVDAAVELEGDGHVIQMTGTHEGRDYVIVGDSLREPDTLQLFWVDQHSISGGEVSEVIHEEAS